MSDKTMWKSLDEILKLKPDRQIWCVSDDGRVDTLTTAGKIAELINSGVDTSTWENVNFGIVGNLDDIEELQDEPKQDEPQFEIKGSRAIHKIKILSSIIKDDLIKEANKFMEDKNVVNIEYQTESYNSTDINIIITYTVMIHYVELS